ncbi:carbon-nitrogen hydrolase family protein [Halobacillus aidingensis]|uniref:Predicted amidohydrolase n=1 Tax=Halobacillus aidingensis TaxID=240303 RepID=A0A1H0H332_HALAD|nr:carbon-nitrogen hydrolase family protein [Halobacillus aidingensis]SDO13512.1 Predicted amidohydrolase [Halobacillus aidingensis]
MNNCIKVAAVQMNCVLGHKAENLKKAERLIREASSEGADIVALPELFNTGYRVEEVDHHLAETIPGQTTDWMMDICKQCSIYLIGCILEESDIRGNVYDTAFIVGPEGVIGKQRKRYLWDKEKQRFMKGREPLQTFKIGDLNVGLQICYEIGFPEPARELSSSGVDVLFYPSAFGKPRNHIWEIASRSRAAENGTYVVACNRTGTEKEETVFAGNSRIVDPSGTVVANAEQEDEVIFSDIDIDEIIRQRKAVPYLRDLEPNDAKGVEQNG